MMEDLCPMEGAVLLARRTGEWTGPQRKHVAECANCQESLAVAGFMNGVADGLRSDETVPGPTLVWLKAQWIEREEQQQRYLVRTAVRRALLQAGALLVLALLVMAVPDQVIGYTLAGLFAFLVLGGFFVIPLLKGEGGPKGRVRGTI